MKFGCDEAGRGPVIGSMFVACVKAPDSELPDDVRDSKKLSNNKIHKIRDKIENNPNIQYSIKEVNTDQIDNCSNLNNLTGKVMSRTINNVNVKSGDIGYIDCFCSEKSKAKELILNHYSSSHKIEIIPEFGADEKYIQVSAASILAKSEREIHINKLSDKFDRQIGSGYPSDTTTRNFLESYVQEHGKIPNCARKSWGTCENILD